ncbi:MAG: hypothetical protein A3G85_06630 [Elusimicrobia bacterium RIFCSPLOWO2_12_FULL_39_28]|nr:MAG: hypothetical protein A3G85_06630 [Elusimicrobia bacterium RIFCSPLOWO2_12_FULL_39_28]
MIKRTIDRIANCRYTYLKVKNMIKILKLKRFSKNLPSLIVLSFFLSPFSSHAKELIITSSEGSVEIQKQGESQWIKAEIGQILNVGDKLRTGAKSKALTLSNEGHKILIKQKTVFIISQLGPVDWEFNEEKGKVRLSVEKLNSGQSLKVKTPTAICSVRGTEFEVTVLENQATMCDVYHGSVGLTDPFQASPEVTILENQRSVIEQGTPPRMPEIIPENERTKDSEISDRSPKGQAHPGGSGMARAGMGLGMGREREGKQFGSGEGKYVGGSGVYSKEQEMARMEKQFQEAMSKFEGTSEEKARIEKEFKENMERFEKEGMMLGHREGDPNPYQGHSDHTWRSGSDEFHREIRAEVNYDLQQEYYQETVKDELRIELVQTSRELIDRSGRRVRLEENVTRPTADSFKFIALSRREGRDDSVVFEVVANKALPTRLEDAGNLWFHFGTTKPEWYALKQRLIITNGRDSITQLFLDGDSKEMAFSDFGFNDSGGFVNTSLSFQTIFNHRYEFINGNGTALDKIWTDSSFRPGNNGTLSGFDVTGMMWHMQPVLVEKYEPLSQKVTGSYWRYSFVTTNGSGNSAVGKMVVTQFKPGSSSNLAHFVQTDSYINFVDTNGNGRLDAGESYEDFNRNGQRDSDEPFEDIVQLGFSGTKDTSRTFSGTGDSTFFSDTNRDNINNDSNSGSDAFRVSLTPWASLKEEMLMIDDQGKIVDFTQIGFGSLSDNKGDQGSIADLFEKLNMERVFTSSEFGGRDIDVIMTPRTFIKAKMVELKLEGNEPIDQRR